VIAHNQHSLSIDAPDGPNALSYTLWAYDPLNTHEHGDGWNGEDLSLFSYADLEGDDDLAASNPRDLSSLIMLGARGLKSWCRPYPLETTGKIDKFKFDMSTGKLELHLRLPVLNRDPLVDGDAADGAINGYTKLYLPYAHYLASNPPSAFDPKSSSRRVLGGPDKDGSEWVKGRGEAVIDLEVMELSEGTLEAEGQWGVWRYPLRRNEESLVRLCIKPRKAV
jgi:hypothetical protein